LREFGGTEGLKELVPLLTDSEPLVRREAINGLALNGSEEASAILLATLTTAAKGHDTVADDLMAIRDKRAAPMFTFLLRHLDPEVMPRLYDAAIEALGTIGTGAGVEAVEALQRAFKHGHWWAPMRTRRRRTAIALALRKIGTSEAIEALRTSATVGPRGVRTAAKAQL
jgi:HEAT repeat protein